MPPRHNGAVMADQTFSNPTRLCDLVMKGGITSGVVYPSAVCELARLYSFKNIGGTSAGAIAAAAAAAAEYGRRQGSTGAAGFAGLARLPEWIGKPGRLVEMFRPDRGTRPLFELVMAALNPKRPIAKIAALAARLLRLFPVTIVVLSAIVVAIWYWLLADLHGIVRLYAGAATIVLAVLAFLVVVIAFLFRELTRTLPRNFYGLSTACDPEAGAAEAPLTNWLTGYLNELAGKNLADGPLTFGDLYAAKPAAGDFGVGDAGYRAINLEMMTTALNLGRPFRLPFRDPDRVFYFSKAEFDRLFPRAVVDHMIAHARRDDVVPVAEGADRLYGFPDEGDLPVVVATRMSLSFPVLLSAVPLYAVDFTRTANQTRKTRDLPPVAERCWFSDGGICSNLPIHFFDAPLPLWPTFAINLKQFHPDHDEEKDAVWLPANVRAGWLPLWTRFEKPGAFGRLSAFLWAIVNTMQNWQDATQARIPGYRDRLVHVSQREDEGGLNLNMPPEVIERLARRGARAGEALVDRFGDAAGRPGDGWTEHRWVRFRSCMDLTSDWLGQIAESYGLALPPDPPLESLLGRAPDAPPSPYRLSAADQGRATEAMRGLVSLMKTWSERGTGFQSDPPRPAPDLRVKPRI